MRRLETVSENRLEALCCVGLVLSVTATLNVNVPTAPGVPVMAPVLERVSPDGRLVADQLSGAFPPVAANVVLYAVFVTPPGKELVVIVNAAAMVNESCLVAVWGVGMAESVAVTVTVKGPLTVGVPEIVPFELMVRPDGRLVAIQLMGAVPPEKPNDVLYPTPITPLGKDVVVIVKAATTVKESCLVASWAVGEDLP